MNRLNIVLLVVVLVLVLLLGVIVARVGSFSIRSASRTGAIDELFTTTDTILPGVPMTVSLGNGDIAAMGDFTILLLRLPAGSVVVREISLAELMSGAFDVTVPCDNLVSKQAGTNQARLLLVDNATQSALAQSRRLDLLSPGPDCVF